MKAAYLNKHIFHGLKNLNTGFDADSIKYFSEDDFQIVLERVEKHQIGITGIEPWKNGEFYDVLTYEDFDCDPTDPKWYNEAFKKFKGLDLQFSATYDISENLLQ